MHIDDILAAIVLGEDSTRQFKADVKNSDSSASEMAAFANCEGGTIYLGVGDDGSTPGLTRADVARINQLISNAAKGLLPYHGLGSGIKRALEEWPDIDFTDDQDGCQFTATVHRKEIAGVVEIVGSPESSGKSSPKTSGKTSGKILNAIRQNAEITIPELAIIMGVTERSIERNIQKLQNTKRLRRVGPARGGHWELIEP